MAVLNAENGRLADACGLGEFGTAQASGFARRLERSGVQRVDHAMTLNADMHSRQEHMCSVRVSLANGSHARMQSEQRIIAAWLIRQRERLGWTWKEWAEKAQIGAPTTISRAVKEEYDSVTGVQTLNALAKAAGLPSVLDFLNDQGRISSEIAAAPPTRPANDDDSVEVRQVNIGYSMGPGAHVDDYPDETPIRFDLNFLRTLTRASADQLFVAKGDGDSMFPTLVNEDQVLIDTTQRVLNLQDRIWAISVHGAGMIKRLRSAGKGRVKILSDNPNVPPDEVDASDLHIVGRVIFVGRRV